MTFRERMTTSLRRTVSDGGAIESPLLNSSSNDSASELRYFAKHCITAHAGIVWAVATDFTDFYSGGDDHAIRVFDQETLVAKPSLVGHTGTIESLVADGSSVYSASRDGFARVWRNSEAVAILDHDKFPVKALAICNGKLYTAADKTIRVWDLATGTQVGALEGHKDIVLALATDDLQQNIYSGSRDNLAMVWDERTGRLVQTLKGHLRSVRCIASDNRLLFSGSWDYSIKAWDARKGDCVATLTGHSRTVYALTASQSCLYSAGEDYSVKIWNTRVLGQCSQTLSAHKDWVVSVCLGIRNRIYSGSADSSVWVWEQKHDS